MTKLRAGSCGVLIPRTDERFFFSFKTSRPTVGPFPRKQSNKGVTLTTHFHLKPRFIISGVYIPIPLTHISNVRWDCSYLHHHTTTSCSGATIVSKRILIYISVYSKYLKFMPIFFTYSSACHQWNEADSRWCLYNPALLFLFQRREFFF